MKKTINKQVISPSYTRRDFLSTSLKMGTAAFTTGLLPRLNARADRKNNVLFMIVDDLRPMLSCYGIPEMHTPNIDRLALRGTLFNRAYCQFPVCNPSRASILTGLRPDSTSVLNNSGDFLQTVPDAVTLPQHFKTHGYHTRSVGKVAHGNAAWLDKLSWSAPIWRTTWKYIDKATSPSWQVLDVGDDELDDGKIANTAVEVLKEIKDLQFFLAVGFNKPHLPFYAPRKYFELYTTQNFELPTISSLPKNAPSIASNRKVLRAWQDIPTNPPLSDEKTLELIRAYAANISYVDTQVGRVLDHLDELNLTESTIIVFCGDHGFQLGEHGMWRKSTLFEVCLRSPLIISIPGQTHFGVKTDALSELVDIYPTLCDTCHLPIPQELEGNSMLPIINQPSHPWKNASFSQYRRGDIDGYSLRTERYRYTEWGNNGNSGVELYDYEVDPDETVNIAHLPENADLVANLSERLHAGWQAALPEIPTRVPHVQTLTWDVNSDGVIDIQDLLLVSNSFGVETLEYPKADVNNDGRVDIIDLLLVASHLGESSNESAPRISTLPLQHVDRIEEWLSEARLTDDGSTIFRKGIANLETLINSVIPKQSVLLPNFPNPFNPETWIPYDLAEDADVNIHIYNLKGVSVKQLSIGFQAAGSYRTQSRAAFWDGRNSTGEPVASGTYFYSLTARYRNKTLSQNPLIATRRMVIVK